MLNKKIEAALNDQIGQELFSAHLYLSMAAYFEHEGLSGFANWAYVQYQEENVHAKHFFDYINDRDGRVIIEKIEAPKHKWESAIEAIRDALAHERKITGCIHRILELTRAEKDYATENMIHWFVKEQVSEESDVLLILNKMEFMEDSRSGLLFLNSQLGERKIG
jgi:ferritin